MSSSRVAERRRQRVPQANRSPLPALPSRLSRKSLRDHFVRCITIDLRTLAVFRIMSGVLILIDLALRAQHLTRFYTEDGLVPREVALEAVPGASVFTLHFIAGSTTTVALLFAIQALFALQLIIGYHTRFASVVSFLFVISLNHRNTLILSHSDVLFRLLLFWGMFVPLGARWSVDAVRKNVQLPPESIASIATAAILLQMVYMYSINGYHKATNELWTGATATLYIFGLDDTVFLIGTWLRQFPTLLRIGGFLWFVSVSASPLLLLTHGRWRWPLLASLIGGHLMFALTVRIGSFPFVAISGALLFLQTEFWRDATRIVTGLRAAAAIEAVRKRIETIGHAAATRLPTVRSAMSVRPSLRAQLSEFATIVAILVVFVMPFIQFLDDEGATDFNLGRFQVQARRFAYAFGVLQPTWTVFAPTPRSTDYYHVFAAEAADGRLYDIYNDRDFTFDRPYKHLTRQYPSYRDRFYLNSVRNASPDGLAPKVLVEHLCAEWLKERGIELRTVEIWVVSEEVTPDTIDDPSGRVVTRQSIFRHGCNGAEPHVLDLPGNPDLTDPEPVPTVLPGEET